MKKIALALIIAAGTMSSLVAQEYKKVFFKTQTVETNDVKVTIDGAVATARETKFKIKIINKTNDYLIYKPSESVFKIGGKSYNPVEKWVIIRPNDDGSSVLNIPGTEFLVAADYDFVLEGLYRVNTNTGSVIAPDFKLPASQNEFKAASFSVTLGKVKKTTARTDAQFIASYNGDKIGIFEPNKVAMKMPDGKEYANYHSDKKPIVFEKGKSDDFMVAWKDIPTASGDMQKDEMTILWRNAFKEVTPEKMKSQNLTVIFDKETSDLKGK
jgi:hypothetical protein